ncbi:MAG: hypothetical protein ACKVVP_02710 [Chloroflexota bacterium]
MAFLKHDITDLQAAGRFLQTLPYGRNSHPANPAGVLDEERGTCSTKHALLASLAREQRISVQLTLGIYEMTEANTPGIGRILDLHGLPLLPEAHCFVTYQGIRVDVTRLAAAAEPIHSFLHEEPITPEQIGEYKVSMHRTFMQSWLIVNPDLARGQTLEHVWAIREACIATLSL